MEESRNANRITGRKALGKQWRTEQWHIRELKGNTKMHQEELGSDTAVCMIQLTIVSFNTPDVELLLLQSKFYELSAVFLRPHELATKQ